MCHLWEWADIKCEGQTDSKKEISICQTAYAFDTAVSQNNKLL